MLALFPEIPKRDQNLKSTPLSERTGIPVCFLWESYPRDWFFFKDGPFLGGNEGNEVIQVSIGRYPCTDFCSTDYQFFVFRVAVESVFLSANRFSSILDQQWLRWKTKFEFYIRFNSKWTFHIDNMGPHWKRKQKHVIKKN